LLEVVKVVKVGEVDFKLLFLASMLVSLIADPEK